MTESSKQSETTPTDEEIKAVIVKIGTAIKQVGTLFVEFADLWLKKKEPAPCNASQVEIETKLEPQTEIETKSESIGNDFVQIEIPEEPTTQYNLNAYHTTTTGITDTEVEQDYKTFEEDMVKCDDGQLVDRIPPQDNDTIPIQPVEYIPIPHVEDVPSVTYLLDGEFPRVIVEDENHEVKYTSCIYENNLVPLDNVVRVSPFNLGIFIGIHIDRPGKLAVYKIIEGKVYYFDRFVKPSNAVTTRIFPVTSEFHAQMFVYGTSDCNIHLAQRDGTVLWSRPFPHSIHNIISISDEKIIICAADLIEWINLKTGNMENCRKVPNSYFSRTALFSQKLNLFATINDIGVMEYYDLDLKLVAREHHKKDGYCILRIDGGYLMEKEY